MKWVGILPVVAVLVVADLRGVVAAMVAGGMFFACWCFVDVGRELSRLHRRSAR